MAPSPQAEAMTTHSPPTHLAPMASQSLPQWLSIDIKQSGDLFSITHQSMQPSRKQSDIANEAGPSSPDNYEVDSRTVRVPAPRMGNTEVPPEDGYSWRKYGQKEILGSRYPRRYYRCTNQKLYNCPAKKQVQRLDNDPYTFDVTYKGDHTCTLSSTAPSMAPSPQAEAMTTHSPPTHLAPMASQSLPQWLSIDIKQPGDLFSITHQSMQPSRNQSDITNEAGPSSHDNYVKYPTETDLDDTMFNPDSSSNKSMELIFSSTIEEKKEGGENIN
ncbi:hypothetical protein M8C21_028229 [Ambrosia artemisiifolia]|uniref:WRKY domain-containing protein n=1 Tax=Ambrosia artemisiifolia TaxID=4212 RepID=A0AAD5CWA9_AMBAR|nr:hypothetical protein M8C21_028229 [Ambrosia artemisiifolia]